MTADGPELSDEAYAKIARRDAQIRAEHNAYPRDTYPAHAQPSAGAGAGAGAGADAGAGGACTADGDVVDGAISAADVDARTAHRKRLVYRSKQRGWLEVDLLLGTWAEENVASLTDEEAAQYEAILNLETIDIYNILVKPSNVIAGSAFTGEVVEETPMLTRLRAYAASSPLATPEAYAEAKRKLPT